MRGISHTLSSSALCLFALGLSGLGCDDEASSAPIVDAGSEDAGSGFLGDAAPVSFSGRLGLRNETDLRQEVTLRYPREDIGWRCEDINPGGVEIPSRFFTEAHTLDLDPGALIQIPRLHALYAGARWDEVCGVLLIERGDERALLKVPGGLDKIDFYEGMNNPERIVALEANGLEHPALLPYEEPEPLEPFARRTTFRTRFDIFAMEDDDLEFKLVSLEEGPEPGCISGLLDEDPRLDTPHLPFEICGPIDFPFEVGEQLYVFGGDSSFLAYNERAYFGININGESSLVLSNEHIAEAPGPYFMGPCGLSKVLEYRYEGERVPMGETLGALGVFDPSIPQIEAGGCPGGA